MATDRRVAQCEGKFRFTSHPLAVKAAKRGNGRWAYACDCCGGFHVGQFMVKHNNRQLVRQRRQQIEEEEAEG